MSIENRDHLQNVGIEEVRVTNAIDFYESYANTVQDELSQVANRLESARDQELVRLNEYQWQLSVDAASSFRQAGHWALLVDINRARLLLGRAGRVFQDLGHAFGLFLLTASRTSEPAGSRDVEVLLQLHQPVRPDQVHEVSEAMYHPQQQAYLLLALCANPQIAEQYYPDLRLVCSKSPHRQGGTPVGALSIPIRHYWATASALLDGHGDQFIREHMAPFVNRYMDNVLSARSNKYLWDHAAAPVDVADVDAIGVVSLAVQRLGREAIASQLDDRQELGFALPAIGRSMLEIGVELGNGRDLGRGPEPPDPPNGWEPREIPKDFGRDENGGRGRD